MQLTARNTDRIERLLHSQIAQRVEAEHAAEVAERRREAIAELREIDIEREKAHQTYTKVTAPLHRDLERHREAIRQLESKAFQALTETNNAGYVLDGRERVAKVALRDSAPPEIWQTRRDLERALNQAMSGFSMATTLVRAANGSTFVEVHNGAQVSKRLADLRAAIAEVDTLAFTAAEPLQVLAEIRSRLDLKPLE